ncbi:ATP-binding protein [Metasolibacillus sp.]|uniref:sensor histidine kinase n=1 Tax=Metasolibacillus sp. TaxID=2703680 RepID=UPI0025E2738E|nr:ATP-binding protein [Metasolibacillus sp.]MCT6923336.1 ATP-binding protein [Metasolibacillus sp.]MCT6939359.1 ATP-binding protein [Metasolibacillus sp.]
MYRHILLFIALLTIWVFAFWHGYAYRLSYTSIENSSIRDFIIITLYNDSTYFIGAAFLIIGFYTYTKKPKSIVIQRYFYLMSVAGIAITYAKPSSYRIPIAYEIETLAVSFSAYFLLYFFERFPTTNQSKLFYQIKWFMFGLALIINILEIVRGLLSLQDSTLFSRLIPILLITNLLITLLSCTVLIIRLWCFNTKWIRNQLAIFLVSSILAFSPLLGSLILDGLFHLENLPFNYTILTIILFPLTLMYLLTKQEVFDFSYLASRVLIPVSALVLMLSVLITILHFIVELPTKQIMQNLIILGSGFTLFLLIHKGLRRLEKPRIEVQLIAMHQQRRQMLKELYHQTFLPLCAEHTVKLIQRMLDVQHVAVIWASPMATVLYDTGLLEKQDIQSLLKKYENTSQINYQYPYHLLPITDESKLLGLVVIGQKINLAEWTKDELILLESIYFEVLQLFLHAQALVQLEQELKSTEHASSLIRHTNKRLLASVEDERKNLSIFLHDDILQQLLVLLYEIRATNSYQVLDEPLAQTIATIRERCQELYPTIVENLGLRLSLQSLQKSLQTQYQIPIYLSCDIDDTILAPELAKHIYRSIKELLQNAGKHANATSITVTLEAYLDSLVIIVEDNGDGFTLPDDEYLYAEQHFGLLTLKRRTEQFAGTMMISSVLQQGTKITITLPLERNETDGD